MNLLSETNYEKMVCLLMKTWDLFRENKEVTPFGVSQAELAWSTLRKYMESFEIYEKRREQTGQLQKEIKNQLKNFGANFIQKRNCI